MRHHCG